MRILLVEDDPMIGASLRAGLNSRGLAVDWVTTATDASLSLKDNPYTVALLDIGLPDGNGLQLLKQVREQRNRLPVLIISARDDVTSRISGLDLGADDYLVKPFDFSEMLARIRAVVRRNAGHAGSLMVSGSVTLDLATHEVTFNDISHTLPAREFSLLRALAERPGCILSRRQLEEKIYGFGDEVESNAIDVLIFYIRKKFGADVIRNVRGAGWMISREPA